MPDVSRPSLLPKNVRRLLQAVGVSLACTVGWMGVSTLLADPVARLEGVLSDFRNRAWMVLYGPSPEDVPSPVTVVDFDERTLQELGVYGEHYREYHAGVVDHLSRNGAAAIVFDVLFKKSDSGSRSVATLETRLRRAGWPIPSDSGARERLRRSLDVSAMLEEAVGRSGRTIIAAQLGNHLDYPNPSDWIPKARATWRDSVWPRSIHLSGPALATLRGLNTLDGVYPALARQAERQALANIEADLDGTVRRLQLLWRFPDTSLQDPLLAPEGTASPSAYPVLSLATTLRLFGRAPDEMRYEPGRWVDLGAPLRVWRDVRGVLRTSAPELTWPMCEGLRAARRQLDSLRRVRTGSVAVAGDVVFRRMEGGMLAIALDFPDSLDDAMVRALIPLGPDTSWWGEVPPDGSPAALSDLVMVRRDTTGFVLATLAAAGDVQRPPTLETTVPKATMRLIQSGLADLVQREVLDDRQTYLREAFSNALDVQWDRPKARFSTPLLALRGSSVEDLLSLEARQIDSLRIGDTIALGDPVRIPVDARGSALLAFPAPARWVARKADESWIRHVSYVDVLNGRLDPGLIPGRVFLLGSSAIAMADFVDAPIEQKHPGVNVQALAIHQWASGNVLRLPPAWVDRLIPVTTSLVAGLLAAYLAPAWALSSAFLMLAGWFALTVQLFQMGWWAPLLGVIGPALLATGTMSALRYLLEEREKRFLHDAFKTYLSPVLIEQMIESGDPPRLGGEERVISAFFSDIQAFSTFSEAIGSPSRLVELLNEYLNSLTNILEANAGALDKYIGDAIVAMFGAPLRVDDHARRAVETAVAMQERLAILRAGWQNQGDAWPEIVHHMRMRIGLNTGPAVTGNMGSQLRMNYTMMGDTVNLAARLESGAKHYGAYILATEATVHAAGPGFACRELDTVQVVGRLEPVVIHEVLGRDSDPALIAIRESFAAARHHYLAGDFAAALDGFRRSRELEPLRGQPGVKTTPSEVFIERCEAYLRDPPKQWSGIHVSTEK